MLACWDCVFESHRGARMSVCAECCDELITRPEESYRVWCVVVCDLETSRMRRPWHALGRSATEKKKYINPLNAELNPISLLLALFRAHHILHVSRIRVNNDGPDSSVGLATRYGLDGLGIKSRGGGGEIFRTRTDRVLVLPSLLYKGYRVFPGGKASGGSSWPPTHI